MYVMQIAELWVGFAERRLAFPDFSHCGLTGFLEGGILHLQAELMNVSCNVSSNLFHSSVVRFIEGSGGMGVSQSAALMQLQYSSFMV